MKRRITSLLAAALLSLTVAAPTSAAVSAELTWKIQVAFHCATCVVSVARAVEIKLYADAAGTYEWTNIGAPSASHQKWEFTWTTGGGIHGPESLIQTGGTIFIPDTHETFEIPDLPRDTGVILVPGHYDGEWLFGDAAGAGMTASIQVTQMR